MRGEKKLIGISFQEVQKVAFKSGGLKSWMNNALQEWLLAAPCFAQDL